MKRHLFSLKRCLFSLKRHLFEAKRRLFNCFHPRQTFLSPRPDLSFTYRRHVSHHWMMPIVIRYRQSAAQVLECEDKTHLQAKYSLVVLELLFAICASTPKQLLSTAIKRYLLFSIAFGRRKCYYSPCFKESESWNMIFDIGDSRNIAAVGLNQFEYRVGVRERM